MKSYLSLIKFSHTVFALPFALVGFFLATAGTGADIRLSTLLYVLLCMVFARSAAMAFNRWLDRDIDKRNPRTSGREIPSGTISPTAALSFTLISSVLFAATTRLINPICFALSPVALAVILGYSYTKRFTALCHFVLGLGLGLAPVGAYLAVAGQFALLPVVYGVAVLCWVSGFDIIYALQDEDFDKSQQLYSMPVWLGRRGALRLSRVLHLICGICLLGAGWTLSREYAAFGLWIWIGTAVFLALLWYQHTLVHADDLSRVNLAFFTTNGIASVVYGLFFIVDFFW